MKQLLQISPNAYLFRRKINIALIKNCVIHNGRNFTALSTLQKPILNIKRQKNVSIRAGFSSNVTQKFLLMDLDVWISPKLFSLQNLYNFYSLKSLDSGFKFFEFGRNTAVAVQVVSYLISQLRFSDLDGLLTPKCKEEVEKNLKYWSKDSISFLAIEPSLMFGGIPCDIILSGNEKKEKKFAEVRVIHYVWLKYVPHLGCINPEYGESKEYLNKNEGNLYIFGVFNSKFIREFKEGVSSQWTVNAINFLYNPKIYFIRNPV